MECDKEVMEVCVDTIVEVGTVGLDSGYSR